MPFWVLDSFRGIRSTLLERNGGDDETRTRDLCRDSRRTSFDTRRYRMSLIIIPLLYQIVFAPLLSTFSTFLAFGILL